MFARVPKYLILLAILVLILAGFIGVSSLLKGRPTPWIETKRILTSLIKPKLKPTKEQPLEIKIQPEGLLKEFPEGILFSFSDSYPEVAGLIVEEISGVIRIDPSVKTSGRWLNENTFEVSFLESLLPSVKYSIEVSGIPLAIPRAIPEKRFSFTTPGFDGEIFLGPYEEERPTVQLDFTLPPVLEKIREYIEISDSKGKKIEPERIKEVQGKPTRVILSLPRVEKEEDLSVLLKKDLPSSSGLSLKKDISAKIRVSPMTMSVASHRIEEMEEGALLTLSFTSPFEKEVDLIIDERNITRFVNISPEIPFDLTTSRNRIYLLSKSFIPQKEYAVTLKPGVMSKKGSILKDEYTCIFTSPEKKKKLQFLYSGRHFGRSGNWNLPLKTAGIKKIGLDIVYLPPENTLFWHTMGYGSRWRFWELGEEVVRGHPIPIEKDGVLWIDLREHLKRSFQPGTYLARIRTAEGGYIEDNIIVVISDLSIVAKWFKKDLHLWCFNSSSLKPEDGVDIEVRTSKNFIYGVGKTDAQGLCHIFAQKEGREPYIIFAKKGDEWTYLHIPSSSLPLSSYDTHGEDPGIPYLAYLYPERELYRPGETVNIGGVVRERVSFKGVSIPIRMDVMDPRGNNFLSLSGNTDEYGLCSFTFFTSASVPTGRYLVKLTSGDKTLYTTGIFVECFVPERMKVSLSLPETFDPYKPFHLKIAAEYLFGAPASNERYRGEVKAEEVQFRHPGYYNYSFGPLYLENERPPSWKEAIEEGNLDEKGEASVKLSVPSDVKFNNPLLLTSNIEVEEGGSGRVTRRSISKKIYTKPFYIGISPKATRIMENQPCQVQGVLLGPDGSLYQKGAKLYYQVFRLSYYYSYRHWEDNDWDERLNRIPVTTKKAVSPSEGKFSFSFTPKTSWDDYLIEVGCEENDVLSQTKVCGWGWWWDEDERRVESPEVLPLRLDKKEYDVDGEVKVSCSLPFEGSILWTAELDNIYASSVCEAKGKVANWSFKAPKGVSTVYITALLVRSGGNYLVQRAFGVQKVRIRPQELKLGLECQVTSQMKPQTDLLVKIKAKERFKATIAVVDEGILQITDFKTPDPYEGILRDLRLRLNSCESFGWIMKRFMERPGGGYLVREKEFPEARFAKIVSFWSGIRESDKNGNLTYKIKIPQFNGRLRVMVVGVSKNGFSAKEVGVIVKSDVIVSPTIPRFMSTQDKFSFPITLINTTKRDEKLSLSINTTGASVDPKEVKTSLSPGEKKTLWFDGEAEDEPGSITLKIWAKSQMEDYKENFVIPLYPNVPYITQIDHIELKANTSLDLSQYFKKWYPRAHIAKLILSSFPGMSRLSHAKYAIGYPYGCIEQTSTSLLVLLRLSPLLPIIAPDIPKEKYIDMVNSGIRRLLSMQTISGGLSFWPGEDMEASPYSNAYACFVLLEAKSSGFLVPENALSLLLSWLNRIEDEKNGFRFYVLAKGGLLKEISTTLDRLITQAEKKELSSKNLLWISASLYELGKRVKAKEFLREALEVEPEKIRRYSDDFYSPLQQLGMRLYVVSDLLPNSNLEKRLVSDLITALAHKDSSWYSTQELAWGLLSLGKYLQERGIGVGEVSAQIEVDGKALSPKKEKYGLLWVLKNPGDKKVILKTGLEEGPPLFLTLENTGFSKERRAFQAYSNKLFVERRILDYYGKPINLLNCGDMAIIELKVWSDGSYDNVAVELPVAAGLEIENPRLTSSSLPNWVKETENLWMTDYADIRDDRVIVFGRTGKKPYLYYIQVRGTTPGVFFLPPVKAMVMYDPELRANTLGGSFEVKKR